MTNYVAVIVDDAGLETVASFATELGSVFLPATPNIAGLEAAGVRFRRFYSNPVCSPTRSLFNTGKYAYKTGVGNNCNLSVNGPPASTEPWLATALDATHTCANIGKWHLWSANNGALVSPLKIASGGVAGYDFHQGVQGNILAASDTYYYWLRYRTTGGTSVLYDLAGAANRIGNSDGIANRIATNYATTITVDDALTWWAATGGDKFLCLAFNAPHSPLHAPPTLGERIAGGYGATRLMSATMETVTMAYSEILAGTNVAANKAILAALNPPWPTDDALISNYANLAAHIAMAETIDTELGRFVTGSGMNLNPTTGDTVLFFFSDNGPTQSITGTLTGKNTVYELGTRVPAFVVGRGVTQQGKNCDRLAQPVDVYRTILAHAGVSPASAVDGVSLVPYFTDVSAPQVRAHAYTEQFVTTNTANPSGGIADIADGSTNDATSGRDWLVSWDRAVHKPEYTMVEHNTYSATHERTVTREMYAFMGGDRLNTTNILLDQDRDFDSARRDTAHAAGMASCLAALAGLEP